MKEGAGSLAPKFGLPNARLCWEAVRMMVGWIIGLLAAWFGYRTAGVLGAVGAFILAAVILVVIELVVGMTLIGVGSLLGRGGKR